MQWLLLAVLLAALLLALARARRSRASRAESRRIALQIIEDRLMLLRGLAYADLLKRRGELVSESVPAPPEGAYQVETEVTWDSPKKQDDLRVTVSVHGGGLGAVRPLFGSFIIAPDGSFVGEHPAAASK